MLPATKFKCRKQVASNTKPVVLRNISIFLVFNFNFRKNVKFKHFFKKNLQPKKKCFNFFVLKFPSNLSEIIKHAS